MRVYFLIAACLALAVAAQAECTKYELDDAGIYGSNFFPSFLPNLLHYNNVHLMSGVNGPWFTIDESAGCSWVVNGLFNCNFKIFSETQRTNPIGTATLVCPDLVKNNDAANSTGGACVLTTVFSTAYPNENRNWRDQSAQVYFEPRIVHSAGQAVANRIFPHSNGKNYLLLWGSDAWTGSNYNGPNRGTGIDIGANLTCVVEPPFVPPCCDEAFPDATAADIASGPVTRTGTGKCVALTFSV